MQYTKKEYDPKRHDRKKALTVKNPYAELIAQGVKTIEVRSRNTTHRGELVICSSQTPVIKDMQSGVTLCTVDLYETKKLSELTDAEKVLTMIPGKQLRELIEKGGFAWKLRNVKRLVEYPVKGQLGIWTLVMDKLEFVHYGGKMLRDLDVDLSRKKKLKKFTRQQVRKGVIIIVLTFVTVLSLVIWLLSLILN